MEFLLVLKKDLTKEQYKLLDDANLEYEDEDGALCFTSRSQRDEANLLINKGKQVN